MNFKLSANTKRVNSCIKKPKLCTNDLIMCTYQVYKCVSNELYIQFPVFFIWIKMDKKLHSVQNAYKLRLIQASNLRFL